jgi:AraC-like DNA-binding protein
MLPVDPLSQVLSMAGIQAAVSTGLEATGRWAIRVAALPTLKCNAVRKGGCWLEVDGRRWRIETGDCFLVAPGLPFVIGTDLSRVPRPAEEVFAGCEDLPIARFGAGNGLDFMCLSGRMDIPSTATILIEALPAVTIIPGGSPVAGRIAWLLDRLEEESRMDIPGRAAMAAQLMQVIFIELIRTLPAGESRGWLAALSDIRVGPAIRAIHADPGRDWRLEQLAEISHLSRSQFSARFRFLVGRAPMAYLLHWRMTVARKALSEPGRPIARIAADLGYSSESAFGVAFRRATGTTPRRSRSSAKS